MSLPRLRYPHGTGRNEMLRICRCTHRWFSHRNMACTICACSSFHDNECLCFRMPE